MQLQSKRENLHQIYSDYEAASHPLRTESICKDGCAFCCTHYGSLDVTTMEVFLIYEWVENTEKAHGIIINQMVRSGDGGPDTIGT